MPWTETNAVDQRQAFIRDWMRHPNVAELSRSYGISRVTAYKWIERYHAGGMVALEDRSRRPKTCPHATSTATQEHLIRLRRQHPTWGPKKLVTLLERDGEESPAASTAGDILRRAGLVKPRTKRRRYPPQAVPGGRGSHPNDVWCLDYKGEFKLGNGRYCYPLTITDEFSRFLIDCRGYGSIRGDDVQQCMERHFESHGLPNRIRSDNGSPFANHGVCGLSRLAVWWLRLGIEVDRNQPHHPEQNGRHERMHRDLKASTCRPPEADMPRQQQRFDGFRDEFNHVRPHEAMGFATPSSRYMPSSRRMPKALPDVTYPGHYEVRKVDPSGMTRLQGAPFFLSHALAGEYVGFVEVDDGFWATSFLSLHLGIFNMPKRVFHPAASRPRTERN